MVKQESSQTCICGQTMSFPEGQIKAECSTNGCGANWELGPEGFWSITPVSEGQLFADAMEKFMKAMAKALRKIYTAINDVAKDVNPKWLNYHKYSKKQRIREKYRRKIVNHVMNAIAAPKGKFNSKERSRWRINH